MNERTLLALGLLLGVGSGKPPDEWLHSAHGYFRDKQAADPMNAAVFTVLLGAAAFYAAEREQNPKVNSYFDALVYVSTNLSVGYSDIFAKTEAGKAIASTLMTYGPALAARVFDVPHEAQERAAEGERSESALRDIAGKLELILQELQSQRGAAASNA
jgi:voltage-gated potassium channel